MCRVSAWHWREELAWLGKPTQRVMAQRDQRSRTGARKIVAQHVLVFKRYTTGARLWYEQHLGLMLKATDLTTTARVAAASMTVI
jgi:hypothetical protein